MVIRCDMCGGSVTIDIRKRTGVCQYCQSVTTLPMSESELEQLRRKQELSSKEQRLLNRAFVFLEDANFAEADKLIEEVLLINSQSARAYVGKLMAELQCVSEKELADSKRPLTTYSSFRHALACAGGAYQKRLESYNRAIENRIEDDKLFEQLSAQLEEDGSHGQLQQLLEASLGFHNEHPAYTELREKIRQLIGYEERAQQLVYEAGKELATVQEHAKEEDRQEEQLCWQLQQFEDRVAAEAGELYDSLRKEHMFYIQERGELLQKQQEAKQELGQFQKLYKEAGIFEWKKKKALEEELELCAANEEYIERKLQQPPPIDEGLEKLLDHMESHEWKQALACSTELGGAAVQKQQARCRTLNQLMEYVEKQQYEKAEQLLRSEALPGELGCRYDRYIDGLQDIAHKQFGDGFAKLFDLRGYRQTDVILRKCAQMKGVKLRFGRYDWRVLAMEEDGWLLILDGLLPAPDTGWEESDNWESSAIRRWLNETFFKEAFSRAQQERILTRQAGDRLFLLSSEEAEHYFRDNADRRAAYLVQPRREDDWSLRTMNGRRFAYVSFSGSIITSGIDLLNESNAVRPAMWIAFT